MIKFTFILIKNIEKFYFTSKFIDNNPIGIGGIILIFIVFIGMLFIVGCLISFISKKFGKKYHPKKNNPSLDYSGLIASTDTSYLEHNVSESSKKRKNKGYTRLNEESKETFRNGD